MTPDNTKGDYFLKFNKLICQLKDTKMWSIATFLGERLGFSAAVVAEKEFPPKQDSFDEGFSPKKELTFPSICMILCSYEKKRVDGLCLRGGLFSVSFGLRRDPVFVCCLVFPGFQRPFVVDGRNRFQEGIGFCRSVFLADMPSGS